MKSLKSGVSNVLMMLATLMVSYLLTLTTDTRGAGLGGVVYIIFPGFFMFFTFIGYFWLRQYLREKAWFVTVLGCAFNFLFALGLHFNF
jgi:hypothetical protein